ncbi:L1 protein [Cervus elaphus papillomavirus 2]|uniref:Major capsid protein L1 n=1 Tax=Cervus elaphus papillomavirus 2 TaxID=1747359 RepID=A0A1I9KHZ5_9PAPI|nr:L1 protein [Cervus elaphus papillomavirus 2]ALP46950.1 L1 protein [Cervus elaphus papillomavirus 2]
MSTFWLPSSGRLYLPPPTPVARILDTDEYVTRTDIFYHTNTERLLTVGHPYFDIKVEDKVTVPKVSGSQFRVFRLKFPDPNKFTFPNPNVYNPENQRLVWGLRGIECCRGQPLGIGASGHPLWNKFKDVENPSTYNVTGTEDRQNCAVDPKQVQMLIVGCTPCHGEHWDKAIPCSDQDPGPQTGDCPPLELKNTIIQDGEMCDYGFGNMNFKALQEDMSGVPLDIVNQTVKYPDFLKITGEPYGNSCFFYAKREQMYARHIWTRAGYSGDAIPNAVSPSDFYLPPAGGAPRSPLGPSVYYTTPSGSLVSSDQQIFNRPYWIQRSQGINNGICWGNELFVTAVDNTRGTNFTISMRRTGPAEPNVYNATEFKQYLRHVEEWELSLILQLCIVDLNPEVLAHIHNMDSTILDSWNLGVIQAPNNIEDQYRYLNSLATRCPGKGDQKEPEDPYAQYQFWTIDLTERFSMDLEQHSLGRKFLFQIGQTRSRKRKAPKAVTFESTAKAPKRRRTKKAQ